MHSVFSRKTYDHFDRLQKKFKLLCFSGHHSFETDSANSNDKISKFQKRKSRSKARGEVRSRLVTIVNINGEVTSFKTVHKKQVRITRSKTMPSQSSQSSLHKNPSKVTVNGTGCWEFKEDF